MGVVSYGRECPSYGVYARVTEVKHWIQFMAQGAEDTKCNKEIPHRPGIIILRMYTCLNNQNDNLIILSGLLVTGGYNGVYETQHTAEVILPSGWSCLLPSLPSTGRRYHSQSYLTACGGWDATRTCHTFTAGEWELSYSLSAGRWGHISWQSPAGILLMGGDINGETTELLSYTDTTTIPGFWLPYKT